MTPPDATIPSAPIFTIEGARATIRLNRPAEHNRLDPGDLNDLREQLRLIDANPAIRVLVLTGSGAKTFCSGYTISALQDMKVSSDGADASLEEVIDLVENLRMPSVCALNGSVYGGGIDLALACDYRIGVSGTRMVMPAARIGLHYYASGMRRYVERLGLAAAKKLFLIGEPMECAEMLRVGFLDELLEPATLKNRTNAVARLIEENAPTTVAGMKRHLNLISQGRYDADAITVGYRMSLRSGDLAEGLAALSAKRKPKFTGR
jgi:enoyl-CoA hydratase